MRKINQAMDIFKKGKKVDILITPIEEEAVYNNKADPDRYAQESDIHRGEHYNRQRRRSRYFSTIIICIHQHTFMKSLAIH